MKIIDAHLHLFPQQDWAEQTAQGVGHHNSVDHLRQVYGQLGMVHGVVMGNHSLEAGEAPGPGDLFHYCVGLDGSLLDEEGRELPYGGGWTAWCWTGGGISLRICPTRWRST